MITLKEMFGNGLGRIRRQDGLFNIINEKEEILFNDSWLEWVGIFTNNFAPIQRIADHKWNYINSKGEIISPNLWFKNLASFHGDLAFVEGDDGKYNLINSRGIIISPNLWFDDITFFHDTSIAIINRRNFFFDKQYKPHRMLLTDENEQTDE